MIVRRDVKENKVAYIYIYIYIYMYIDRRK